METEHHVLVTVACSVGVAMGILTGYTKEAADAAAKIIKESSKFTETVVLDTGRPLSDH